MKISSTVFGNKMWYTLSQFINGFEWKVFQFLTFTWINSSLNLQFIVSNSCSWLLEILNWFLNLATYNFKTKGYFREYHNIKHNVPFITLFILFKKSKICHKCNVLMWSKLFYEYNFPAQAWISVSRYICFICM